VQRKNWTVENVIVDPETSGAGYGGKGLMVFCGTQNVTVRNVTMPGGEVVMEGSSGKLLVENSCVKGVRQVAGGPPIQQSGNSAPPCGGTPPPSTTTTTTRPPTTTSTTTTTTQPPVTTAPPVTTQPSASTAVYCSTITSWIKLLEEERAILNKIGTDASKKAIKKSDQVHDELVAQVC
jgi:hypothetical protein